MMRRRKFAVILLSLVLALSLCTAAACGGKEEEKAPTVTITSGDGTITTKETYTLAYTATDATKEEVTVAAADGKVDSAVYDEAAKTFRSSVPGVFTLTVTVTNVEKTAQKSVTVTVTEAPDTDDPVLTLVGRQDKYEVQVGQAIALPKATAEDPTEGDLTADIEVTRPQGTTLTKQDDDTYEFVAAAAGTFSVTYAVEDSAGNYDEQFVEVTVTPLTAETTVSADDAKIENLNTSGKIYRENFANPYGNGFSKGLTWNANVKASVVGDKRAIAGNSLLLDYADCQYNTDTKFFFGSMTQYLRSGKWTVSMDVKVVKGNVPNGKRLYFFYVQEGQTQATDNGGWILDTTKTNRVSFDQILTLDTSNVWHFGLFCFSGDAKFEYDGLQLAIDNIEFTWTEAVNAIVEPTTKAASFTAADLDAGVQVVGKEKAYSELIGSSVPKYLAVDKLVKGLYLTEEQAKNLTAANGFGGDWAGYTNGQILAFKSFKDLCVDPNYEYTLTMKVYLPKAIGNWHLWYTPVADASSQGGVLKTLPGGDLSAGLHTWTVTFDGKANYANVGLYGGGTGPVFIGDVTLARTKKQVNPVVERKGTPVTVTAEQAAAQGGYTLDQTDANYTGLETSGGDPQWVEIAKLEPAGLLTAEQAANLTADNGFHSPYAIRIRGEQSFLSALNGLCTDPTKDYTVSFKIYSNGASDASFHLWYADGSSALKSFGHPTGVKTWTATFTGNAAYTKIGFYRQGDGTEFYIGDVTVSSAPHETADTTPKGYQVGKTWVFGADNKISSSTTSVVNTADVTLADGSKLSEQQGFDGVGKVILFDQSNDKTGEMFRFNEITETNCEYKITVVYYCDGVTGQFMVRMDSTFEAISGETGAGSKILTVTKPVDFFSLYVQGDNAAKVYVASVTVELTKIN